MSYPRAGCVWVCKIGRTIVNRDHLCIPLYAKPLASLVFPSRNVSSNQTAEEGLPESKDLKEKK